MARAAGSELDRVPAPAPGSHRVPAPGGGVARGLRAAGPATTEFPGHPRGGAPLAERCGGLPEALGFVTPAADAGAVSRRAHRRAAVLSRKGRRDAGHTAH